MAADRTSHKLIHQELAAIECPLQLRQELPSDDPTSRYARLVDRLGGLSRLSSLLCAKDPNRPVELNLIKSSSNHFIRPVAGEFVNTSNILIKIIKRTRETKKACTFPAGTSSNETQDFEPQSIQTTRRIYKIEPVGVIPLTVRFRALADYHYTPDLKHPINSLARDIRSLNAERILKFRFDTETEDYSSSSKIALFPPPLFSRYLVPQLYNYRQNIQSVVTDPSEGYPRLVNKAKYVPEAPQSTTFDEPQVPQGPLESTLNKKKALDEQVYQKIEALFEERPMWIRVAFQNQLSPHHVRLLRQNREILALNCYTFTDGPFKDFLIKFKYDPRVNPEARFFQRISLRNLDKTDASEKFTFKLMKRPVQRAANSGALYFNQRDHIFDGLELHQSVGTYQLCDITDPLLKSLINSNRGVLPKCHVRTGWYTSNAIEQIRSILRKKFHALLDGQRVIKDMECMDLLDIDISQDAVDLVKKYSVTEKRGLSKFYTARDVPELDPSLDQLSTQTGTDRPLWKSSPVKLHPNPLLKNRREKNRLKAKPKDKSVTFLDLDEHAEMVGNDQNRKTERTTDNMRSSAISMSDTSTKANANEIREMEVAETDNYDNDDDMDDDNSEDDDDDDDQEEEEDDDDEELEGLMENEDDGVGYNDEGDNVVRLDDRQSSDISGLNTGPVYR